MGVAALLGALARDADAEVARRRAEAEAESARLIRDAEERLAAHRARTLRERERELRASAAVAREQARAEHGRAVLDARRRFLARVQAGALAHAGTLDPDGDAQVEAALRALVDEAAAALPVGTLAIHSAPGLAAALGRVTRAMPELAVGVEADAAVDSGFLLAPVRGGVTVDQRFGTRIRRHWGDLAIELVRLVGGADPVPRATGGE